MLAPDPRPSSPHPTASANAAELLHATALARRRRPAFERGPATCPYGALDDAAAHVAGLLGELGLVPGDRVALVLRELPELAMLYFGVLRAGGVVVALDPADGAQHLAAELRATGSRVVFAGHDVVACVARAAEVAGGADVHAVRAGHELEELVLAQRPRAQIEPRADDDVAAIVFSPRVGASPRPVALTHAGLRAAARRSAALLGLEPGDVLLDGLPVARAAGQTAGLLAATAAGALLRTADPSDPDAHTAGACDAAVVGCARGPAAGVPGGPRVVLEVAQEPAEAHPARAPRDEPARLRALAPDEAAGLAVLVDGAGGLSALPGLQARAVDDRGAPVDDGRPGLLALRGPGLMSGYWRQPRATASAVRAGWLVTSWPVRSRDGALRLDDIRARRGDAAPAAGRPA